MGGNDHLVAMADARRLERERERRGPRGDTQAPWNPAAGGEFRLEAVDLLAQHEGAAADDTIERGLQLATERRMLTIEGDERDDVLAHGGYAIRRYDLRVEALRHRRKPLRDAPLPAIA